MLSGAAAGGCKGESDLQGLFSVLVIKAGKYMGGKRSRVEK